MASRAIPPSVANMQAAIANRKFTRSIDPRLATVRVAAPASPTPEGELLDPFVPPPPSDSGSTALPPPPPSDSGSTALQRVRPAPPPEDKRFFASAAWEGYRPGYFYGRGPPGTLGYHFDEDQLDRIDAVWDPDTWVPAPFYPSSRWDGKRPGYAFRRDADADGLGYYFDPLQVVTHIWIAPPKFAGGDAAEAGGGTTADGAVVSLATLAASGAAAHAGAEGALARVAAVRAAPVNDRVRYGWVDGDDDDATFERRTVFGGGRDGQVFTRGPRGLGYYADDGVSPRGPPKVWKMRVIGERGAIGREGVEKTTPIVLHMAQDTILEVVRFEDDSTGTCRCYVGGAVSAWYSLRTASTKILAYEDDADDPDLVYYPGRVSYFPGELFFDHNDMPNWHREPARGFYEKEIDEERAGKVKYEAPTTLAGWSSLTDMVRKDESMRKLVPWLIPSEWVKPRCNYCQMLDGEKKLVGVVTLKKCSLCKRAWYCDRKCQQMAWGRHKYYCKASADCISDVVLYTGDGTTGAARRVDEPDADDPNEKFDLEGGAAGDGDSDDGVEADATPSGGLDGDDDEPAAAATAAAAPPPAAKAKEEKKKPARRPRFRKDSGPTLYDLLGIDEDAATKDVRRAFFELARLFHPDHNRGLSDARMKDRQEHFIRIQNAYDILKDENKRAAYDAEMYQDADHAAREKEMLLRPKVVVIVPYRQQLPLQDRQQQMDKFVPYMIEFLDGISPKIDYQIIIVEQTEDGRKFNAGALRNVGFDLTRVNRFDWVIFHDIDLLPHQGMRPWYATPPLRRRPIHLGANWKAKFAHESFFGGVVSMCKEDFIDCNGYPNDYWGWGLEDAQFYLRCRANKFQIARPPPDIGSFEDLDAVNMSHMVAASDRSMTLMWWNVDKIEKSFRRGVQLDPRWKWNGVAVVEYKIDDLESMAGTKVLRYKVELCARFDDICHITKPADWDVTNQGQIVPLSMVSDGEGRKRSTLSIEANDLSIDVCNLGISPYDRITSIDHAGGG